MQYVKMALFVCLFVFILCKMKILCLRVKRLRRHQYFVTLLLVLLLLHGADGLFGVGRLLVLMLVLMLLMVVLLFVVLLLF